MTEHQQTAPAPWVVYIVRTARGMLYTGITTDMPRRLEEHGGSERGAKSLRGKGPLTLVFQHPAENRSEASILEARIKRFSKTGKLALIRGDKSMLGKLQDTK